MTPKAGERWRRRRAVELGLTPRKLNGVQRTLLRHLLAFHEAAQNATTDTARFRAMTSYQRTLDRLTSKAVRGWTYRRR